MADFCRFLILTEIVLNHMTETAEILPKGLTVEKNDFDRCKDTQLRAAKAAHRT